MKVCINYTYYLGDGQWEDLMLFACNQHKAIADELGYDICCNTYGIHRNAERLHLHLHSINDIKNNKIFKGSGLASKIKRLACVKSALLIHKEFVAPEMKISTNYDDAVDYDVVKILAYPLKEYDTNASMAKEVNIEACFNVTDHQLEELRKYSHKLYQSQKNAFEKKEIKKSKKEDLYSHLDNVIVTTNIPDIYGEMDLLMRYTIKQILLYYKMNNKNFSIHQLKNQAVNYLYFKDIIDETQICNYINI